MSPFPIYPAGKGKSGKVIDDAVTEIEKQNPQLKGVLSKDYARPALDKQRLGELIDLIGHRLGDRENRSKDIHRPGVKKKWPSYVRGSPEFLNRDWHSRIWKKSYTVWP